MLAEDESPPDPRPGDCSYCGEQRPDVRCLVTLPDGRGVDICGDCLALAQQRFGGAAGPPRD